MKMREEYDISILKYPVINLDTILKNCKGGDFD